MDKVAAIGMFDGLHRGHRFLLDRLKAEAATRGLCPCVYTFRNHPLSLLRPDSAPPLLMSASQRTEAIRRAGVEPVMLTFSPELQRLTAAQFVEQLKRDGVKLLLMGFNNRIGSDRCRAADIADLGIEVIECEPLGDGVVSSSAVRRALAAGDVEQAARLLGRPYVLSGTVGHGRELGRTIGFPTANLEPEPGLMIPAPGVYAAKALGLPAVVNIGHRPTVDHTPSPQLTIEVHIIGFSGNLYDRELSVEFRRRLRGEQRFNSLNGLKKQITQDCHDALF